MTLLYLVALLLALGGMVLVDRRFRLVFWRDARRAGLVVAIGVGFFLAWDLAGIAFGVFARGPSAYLSGLDIAPELPLEEVVFLTFLCYLTLVLLSGSRALLDRGSRP